MARVLVVDDDPDLRSTLADVLELAGYDVVTAADGPTALSEAAWECPDVVLLDVMLPGMSGLHVLERLRAQETFAQVPVIMVTALTDVKERVRALAMGADDYLGKPFEMAELIARVQAALRQRRLVKAVTAARAETARLNREMVVAEEELRGQVSADIHDTILQTLVGLRFWLEHASEDESLPGEKREEVRALLGEVDESLATGRRLIRGLRPPVRPRGGLPALIRAEAHDLARGADIDVGLELPDRLEGLTPESETMVFRIVREAVLNAVRHADAHRIDVTLATRDRHVTAVVTDDGHGFDPTELAGAQHAGHFGLQGMRVRAESAGGALSVDSGPGRGTTVVLDLPREVA